MIAQNEINVQGELGNKTDNCTVSYKHRTRTILKEIEIMVSVRLYHTQQ